MSTLPTRRWRRGAAGLAAGALVALATLAISQADPAPAPAATNDFSEPVFSADARGDIFTIGNAQITCDETYSALQDPEFLPNGPRGEACNPARSGQQPHRAPSDPMTPGGVHGVANNDFASVHVDVDDDPSTFSSTTADLDIPEGSAVLWAGLHWFGSRSGSDGNVYFEKQAPPDPDAWDQVRLSVPGAADLPVVAEETWTTPDTFPTPSFAGYADVTTQVAAAGAGTYTLADIQTWTGYGPGYFAGWSLTVVVAHPDMPPRNLTVWHGWDDVADGERVFELSGFTPPPAGEVSARLGVVAADGDRDRTGEGVGDQCRSDAFEISSDTAPAWRPLVVEGRPWLPTTQQPGVPVCSGTMQDFFNSSISDTVSDHPALVRDPQHATNQSMDIAVVEDTTALTNTSDVLRFRARSLVWEEQVLFQVFHAAIDLYPPEITIEKDVVPVEPGPLRPGDEVEWTLTARNDTQFDLHRARLIDPLPDGVTFVPGSLAFADGGPTDLLGPKTDVGGDDQAEYDPVTRTVSARMGAGADGRDGGVMAAPDRSTDGSERLVLTFRTTLDDLGAGTVVTNEVTATGEAEDLDDPFPPITSEDTDTAEVEVAPAPPDLVVHKATEDQTFTAGTENTYTLTVENRGGPEPAAVLTDVLRPGLELVEASDGGTFDPTTRTVTWELGPLDGGATAEVHLVVRVATPLDPALVDETGVVPNTVRLRGEGDCTTDGGDDPECSDTVDNPTGDPHLWQDKVVDRAEAEPGEPLTYSVTVGNDGDEAATGVVAVDTLPDEVELVEASTRVGTIEADGSTLTWTIGELAAGAEVEMEVQVAIDDGEWDTRFVNRVVATHDTECVATCPPTTVAHPCDDDPAASCAPTRTPPRTPPTTDPEPEPERRPSRPGSGGTPASSARPASRGSLPRTGLALLPAVAVSLAVGTTGACLLVAARRPARRR